MLIAHKERPQPGDIVVWHGFPHYDGDRWQIGVFAGEVIKPYAKASFQVRSCIPINAPWRGVIYTNSSYTFSDTRDKARRAQVDSDTYMGVVRGRLNLDDRYEARKFLGQVIKRHRRYLDNWLVQAKFGVWPAFMH